MKETACVTVQMALLDPAVKVSAVRDVCSQLAENVLYVNQGIQCIEMQLASLAKKLMHRAVESEKPADEDLLDAVQSFKCTMKQPYNKYRLNPSF